jgi:mono/diheme cytochrome c family protein
MPTVTIVRRVLVVFVLSLASSSGLAADPETAPTFTAEQVTFFNTEVQPLLAQNCLKCHGADEKKIRGGLRLTSRADILAGGDSGPAVNLKDPDQSFLLLAINNKRPDGGEVMPPSGQMSAADIATLTRWVKEGLPVSADKLGDATQQHEERAGIVTLESRNYWAFKPVARPEVPAVKDTSWIKTPIDAFILAKLEAKGLSPNPPADKVALVRRAYYDLIGLPPTPEQVDEFVNDSSPDAFPKLVDQLLASPHYGEKWGRHWLDVVRYAETNGYERDGPKPFAWRYRDYVIRSFNADKPYDQFIREQIAGDEMPRGDDPDPIIATGFYRLGLWDDEPVDPEESLFDSYDDYITVVGQGFLAMTLNCARCHDHKKDPIPQADYYRLLAFFRDIRPFSLTRDVRSKYNLTDITPAEQRKVYEAELKKRQDRIEELTKLMTLLEDEAIKKMPAEDQRASEGPDRPQVVAKVNDFFTVNQKWEYAKLKRERADLERKPYPNQTFALSVNNCFVKPPETHILARGNPHALKNDKTRVEPGFPQVLGFPDPVIPEPDVDAKSSGRRTVLANWLAAKENPLTARVMVNRIWHYHFGKGIVPTPSDFGQLGEPPTHPELLDWLASEFMDGGWTIKRLHRLIMLSSVYQQSTAATEAGLSTDPANTLYWRYNMRRLTAEEVRDSILAVSGKLDRTLYGESVYPKIPREVLAGQSVPGEGWHYDPKNPNAGNRRSIYVHMKRSLQVPILIAHDQADTDSPCPVRHTTTVPTQALGMLNGEFTNEQAAALAKRLTEEAPGDVAKQVARAIRLTTGRIPEVHEVSEDIAFIMKLKSQHGLDDLTALTRYALLVLNANEFVYLD